MTIFKLFSPEAVLFETAEMMKLTAQISTVKMNATARC